MLSCWPCFPGIWGLKSVLDWDSMPGSRGKKQKWSWGFLLPWDGARTLILRLFHSVLPHFGPWPISPSWTESENEFSCSFSTHPPHFPLLCSCSCTRPDGPRSNWDSYCSLPHRHLPHYWALVHLHLYRWVRGGSPQCRRYHLFYLNDWFLAKPGGAHLSISVKVDLASCPRWENSTL